MPSGSLRRLLVFCSAGLALAVSARGQTHLMSFGPTSPEVVAGTYDPAAMLLVDDACGALTRIYAPSDLGLRAGEHVDAFTTGDYFPLHGPVHDISWGSFYYWEYSVDPHTDCSDMGAPPTGIVGSEMGSNGGNGAASDTFAVYVYPPLPPLPPVRVTDHHCITPLPAPESDIDSLDWALRQVFPAYFSVDRVTAAELSSRLGTTVTAADVLVATAPGVVAIHVPHGRLGLTPADDLNALATLDGKVFVFSVDCQSPSQLPGVGSGGLYIHGLGAPKAPWAFAYHCGLDPSDDLNAVRITDPGDFCEHYEYPTGIPTGRPIGVGLGHHTFGPIDLEAATGGDILCLGVEYLNGHYYVTGSGSPQGHVVHVLDRSGALVRRFPANVSGTTFGYRDGATDGQVLMFGHESGIHVIDTNGNPASTVLARNGPQTLSSNPIQGAGLSTLGTYRALAFDPDGHGGNGSLWTANFGSPLLEIALDGSILRSHPLRLRTSPTTWMRSIYGLAFDPVRETLWANSYPNQGDLVELSCATGLPTGRRIRRESPTSAQGGLTIVPGGAGLSSSAYDLVALDQRFEPGTNCNGSACSLPDHITGYRLHLDAEVPGPSEWVLGLAVQQSPGHPLAAVPFDGTDKYMESGNLVRIAVQSRRDPAGLRGLPYVLMWNFEQDAERYALTPFFPELVSPSPFSSPPGLYPSFFLFDGFVGGPDILIPAPNTLPYLVVSGLTLRLQAIVLDGRVPRLLPGLGKTNTAKVKSAPLIRVEAVGDNSFNADATSGYWRVIHSGPGTSPSITRVEITSTTSGVPTQRGRGGSDGHTFDTDETGMADRFDGDDGAPGCMRTYRNGSDVATGLIYAGTDLSPCDPGGTRRTGFRALDPITGDASRVKTLRFDFAGGTFRGRTFEFDCDTDGGLGIKGSDQRGLAVTITLSNGRTRTKELMADASNKRRAFADFQSSDF